MLTALLLREAAPTATADTPSQPPRAAQAGPPEAPARSGRLRRWLRGWEWALTLLYAALLAAVIRRHEPWFDEAQAWLIARDSTLGELLNSRMRYEGSPPLWHLILMPATRLHLPYPTLSVIAAVISLAGVWIFVRRAPFPAVVRILFPFSFFIFYQYGVIARSYCLLAPLLFLLAALHPRRVEAPWRWCLLLGLLANVSVHGLVIAGALQALHLVDVGRAWRSLSPAARRAQVATSTVLLAVAGVIVYELLPPADLTSGAGVNLSVGHFVKSASENLVHAISVNVLSVAILLVTAWWLWRTRCLLLYVVPTLAVLLVFSIKYFNVWHEGTLFLLWVFALWVSFSRSSTPRRAGPRPRLAMSGVIVLALVVQVAWTIESVRYDWGHNYSGSREMADYIKAHGIDHTRLAALNYGSVALLPYFDRDIFIDLNGGHGPSYFLWSSRILTLPNDPNVALAMNPDYIVVAVKSYTQVLPCLVGYRSVHSVPGDLYWKTRLLEPEAFILYARSAGGTANCGPPPALPTRHVT